MSENGDHEEPVRIGIIPPPRNKRSNILLGLAAVLGMIVVLLALVVANRSSRGEELASSDARRTQQKLEQAEQKLDQILLDRELEQDEEDCRDLYKDDIIFAGIREQVADSALAAEEGNLVVLLGRRGTVPEGPERTALGEQMVKSFDEMARLSKLLSEKGVAAENALVAFTDYIDTLPFQGCHHARWPKGQSNP